MMHIEFDAQPEDIDEQCELLEQVAEQVVRAHLRKITAAPDDTYPCCVRCAKLQFQAVPHMAGVRNAPLTDEQRAALETTVQHGHPTSQKDRDALEGILDAHGFGLRLRGVDEIVRRRKGTAIDLATFQCAQERKRGKDCFVAVDFDEGDGNIHAYVKYPDGTMKNPQDDTVPGECGCGGKHAEPDTDDQSGSSTKPVTLSSALKRGGSG